MNYRHVYHAGNFADVVKHSALALCLDYLAGKDKPFCVIDTHAGAGCYDLASIEAGRTLEYADGVGRLLGVDALPIPESVSPLLEPYLACVRAANAGATLTAYPGSPVIARRFLRAGDRLVACELHPAERTSLENLFRADTHVRVLGRDGWAAMKALLPPPERRGLVLIDPPFEARGEFERLAAALGVIRTRFATGMALAWFPLKDGSETAILDAALELGGESKWLRADFRICMARDGKMTGCGLLALNPPWTLRAQLDALLAFLAERLAQGPGAGYDLRCSRR